MIEEESLIDWESDIERASRPADLTAEEITEKSTNIVPKHKFA